MPETSRLIQRLDNKCLRLSFVETETCRERRADKPCCVCQAAASLEDLEAENARLRKAIRGDEDETSFPAGVDDYEHHAVELQDAYTKLGRLDTVDAEMARLRAMVADLADRLAPLLRARHDHAHHGDIARFGSYEVCSLCADTRQAIHLAREAATERAMDAVVPGLQEATTSPLAEARAQLERVLADYDLRDAVHGLDPSVDAAVRAAVDAMSSQDTNRVVGIGPLMAPAAALEPIERTTAVEAVAGHLQIEGESWHWVRVSDALVKQLRAPSPPVTVQVIDRGNREIELIVTRVPS